MITYVQKSILILILCAGMPVASMQPVRQPRTAEEQFIGAVMNYLPAKVEEWLRKGVNVDAQNKNGRTALSFAAGNGFHDLVALLLKYRANINLADANGLTPLSWAAIQYFKDKDTKKGRIREEDYLQVIKLLVNNGANLYHIDNGGFNVLHKAVAAGSPSIVQFLLENKARSLINTPGGLGKGRTPMAELFRAARAAIVHLSLEEKNLQTPDQLRNELPEALKELADKDSRKLTVDQMLAIIRLLIAYGANWNIPDALGHTPDYYINEVMLITDQEREKLLNALSLPITKRNIQYITSDLIIAREQLKELQSFFQGNSSIVQKINMIIWTLHQIPQQNNKVDVIRIAMALLSKVKEQAKEFLKNNPKLFKETEVILDNIRTILRDTALILAGKVTPSIELLTTPKQTAPLPSAPQSLPRSQAISRPQPQVIPSPMQAATPSPEPRLGIPESKPRLRVEGIYNKLSYTIWLIIYNTRNNVRTTVEIKPGEYVYHGDFINEGEIAFISANPHDPTRTAIGKLSIMEKDFLLIDKTGSKFVPITNKPIMITVYEEGLGIRFV